VNMSVKWMKQEGTSGAKHGRDMRVLYETNYNPLEYIGYGMGHV